MEFSLDLIYILIIFIIIQSLIGLLFLNYYTSKVGISKFSRYVDKKKDEILQLFSQRLENFEDISIGFDLDINRYEQLKENLENDFKKLNENKFSFEKVFEKFDQKISILNKQNNNFNKKINESQKTLEKLTGLEEGILVNENKLNELLNNVKQFEQLAIKQENNFKVQLENKVTFIENTFEEKANLAFGKLDSHLEQKNKNLKKDLDEIEKVLEQKMENMKSHEQNFREIIQKKYERLLLEAKDYLDKMILAEKQNFKGEIGDLKNQADQRLSTFEANLKFKEEQQDNFFEKQKDWERNLNERKKILDKEINDLAEKILTSFKEKIADYQEDISDNLKNKYGKISDELIVWEEHIIRKENQVIDEIDNKFFDISNNIEQYKKELSKDIEIINQNQEEIKNTVLIKNQNTAKEINGQIELIKEKAAVLEDGFNLKEYQYQGLSNFIEDSKKNILEKINIFSAFLDEKKKQSQNIFNKNEIKLNQNNDELNKEIRQTKEIILLIKNEHDNLSKKWEDVLERKYDTFQKEYNDKSHILQENYLQKINDFEKDYKSTIAEKLQSLKNGPLNNLENQFQTLLQDKKNLIEQNTTLYLDDLTAKQAENEKVLNEAKDKNFENIYSFQKNLKLLEQDLNSLKAQQENIKAELQQQFSSQYQKLESNFSKDATTLQKEYQQKISNFEKNYQKTIEEKVSSLKNKSLENQFQTLLQDKKNLIEQNTTLYLDDLTAKQAENEKVLNEAKDKNFENIYSFQKNLKLLEQDLNSLKAQQENIKAELQQQFSSQYQKLESNFSKDTTTLQKEYQQKISNFEKNYQKTIEEKVSSLKNKSLENQFQTLLQDKKNLIEQNTTLYLDDLTAKQAENEKVLNEAKDKNFENIYSFQKNLKLLEQDLNSLKAQQENIKAELQQQFSTKYEKVKNNFEQQSESLKNEYKKKINNFEKEYQTKLSQTLEKKQEIFYAELQKKNKQQIIDEQKVFLEKNKNQITRELSKTQKQVLQNFEQLELEYQKQFTSKKKEFQKMNLVWEKTLKREKKIWEKENLKFKESQLNQFQNSLMENENLLEEINNNEKELNQGNRELRENLNEINKLKVVSEQQLKSIDELIKENRKKIIHHESIKKINLQLKEFEKHLQKELYQNIEEAKNYLKKELKPSPYNLATFNNEKENVINLFLKKNIMGRENEVKQLIEEIKNGILLINENQNKQENYLNRKEKQIEELIRQFKIKIKNSEDELITQVNLKIKEVDKSVNYLDNQVTQLVKKATLIDEIKSFENKVKNNIKEYGRQVTTIKKDLKNFEQTKKESKAIKKSIDEIKDLNLVIKDNKNDLKEIDKKVKSNLALSSQLNHELEEIKVAEQEINSFIKEIKIYKTKISKIKNELSQFKNYQSESNELSQKIKNLTKQNQIFTNKNNSISEKLKIDDKLQEKISIKLKNLEDNSLMLEKNYKRMKDFSEKYDQLDDAIIDLDKRTETIDKLKSDLLVEKKELNSLKENFNEQISLVLKLINQKNEAPSSKTLSLNNKENESTIKKLHVIGWSEKDIAQHLNVSITEVKLILTKKMKEQPSSKIKEYLKEKFYNISFEEVEHRYFNNQNEEYTSISSLLARYSAPFDSEKMSRKVAEREKVPQNEIKTQWDLRRDYSIVKGTEFHLYAETFLNENRKIDLITPIESQVDLFHKFWDNRNQHKYEVIATELIVYSEKYKIAGTIDCIVRHNKTKNFFIMDWKTNRNIRTQNSYTTKMQSTLKHLDDCELNKYSLQMELYKRILSDNTEINIEQAFIIHFPPENNYQIHITKDLSKEVNKILENNLSS